MSDVRRAARDHQSYIDSETQAVTHAEQPLPDVEGELGPLVKAQHDPRTPAYWDEEESGQWSAQLTHRIKTLYGFYTIRRFIEAETQRKKAEDAFLYLMD